MSANAKGLQVTIMGREFRVACKEDEQQQLLTAVDYLNKKMQEIKEQGKMTGTERIAIMAALNIAHEFLTTRVSGDFDIAELKRRMTDMATTIDRALIDQSELF